VSFVRRALVGERLRSSLLAGLRYGVQPLHGYVGHLVLSVVDCSFLPPPSLGSCCRQSLCTPADLILGCCSVLPNGVVVSKRLVVVLLLTGSSTRSIRYA